MVTLELYSKSPQVYKFGFVNIKVSVLEVLVEVIRFQSQPSYPRNTSKTLFLDKGTEKIENVWWT